MWNEETRSAVVLVGLLGSIVLIAYLFSTVVGNGVTSTAWPNPEASSLPFFCLPSDSGPVGCFREWIDPIAAIFTVAAIIFAARQVFEANRQSDAAVRASLVTLRTDLVAERANIEKVIAHYRLINSRVDQLRSAAESFGGDVSEAAADDLLALLLSSEFLEDVNAIEAFRGSGVSALDEARSEASLLLLAQYGRWRETAGNYQVASLDVPETEAAKFGTNAEGMRAHYRRTLVAEVRRMRSLDTLMGALKYRSELDNERATIVDVIAEIDQEVLKHARQRRSSSAGRRRHEEGERVRRLEEMMRKTS